MLPFRRTYNRKKKFETDEWTEQEWGRCTTNICFIHLRSSVNSLSIQFFSKFRECHQFEHEEEKQFKAAKNYLIEIYIEQCLVAKEKRYPNKSDENYWDYFQFDPILHRIVYVLSFEIVTVNCVSIRVRWSIDSQEGTIERANSLNLNQISIIASRSIQVFLLSCGIFGNWNILTF